MGLSKTNRIVILLCVDSLFFFLELIVGYAVHSLALVADSFHMLNDVLSLFVGLWAVRVANQGSSKMFTYGWQRAETLGALVNGVFLIALCLSIFLEAIQRFVEPQVVSNPKLVMIVGCFGLASNILGLFLFHDHGHSHGGHSHGGGESHSHGHSHVSHAEEGRSKSMKSKATRAGEETSLLADEGGHIEDVLPQVRVAGYDSQSKRDFTRSDETNTTITNRETYSSKRKSGSNDIDVPVRRSRRRSRIGSIDDIPIHPASMRQEFIKSSRFSEEDEGSVLDTPEGLHDHSEHHESNGATPAQNGSQGYGSINQVKSPEFSHANHIHRQPRKESASGGGGHGHSHGDLNMRGVFLHVMGDALGNIGVIVSALIIWLTDYSWRYYFDPGISLIITVIILSSAIPLCKAASRILLQAVPVGMSIDEITSDIEDLEGVAEAHHLHVWQLSDTKLVASLHVKVDCEIKDAGSASYMKLARAIRQCLHEYGIHSSTIQPEFLQGDMTFAGSSLAEHAHEDGHSHDGHAHGGSKASKTASLRSTEGPVCMLDCEDDCDSDSKCCPPSVSTDNVNGNGKSKDTHNHGHDHDHSNKKGQK